MSRRPCTTAALLAAVALLSAAGCDTSLDAFKKTDRAYSVFGYLDANADRQQVRVEPLQDSTFVGSGETGSGETGSGEIGARVTSENVETGERVVWEERVSHVGANRVPVHNFTTSADFEPGATYRFRMERASDGAASTARVTLPPAFPKPEVKGGFPNLRDTSSGPRAPTTLKVEGVDHIRAVRADYDYRVCLPSGCRRRQAVAYPLSDTLRTDEGAWLVQVFWDQHIPDIGGENVDVTDIEAIYSFNITVAAASEDWPEYAEGDLPSDPTDAPLPPSGAASNVKNGAGFLGGAFTRTVEVPVVQ